MKLVTTFKNYSIYQTGEKDSDVFWIALGRFFASKQVRKELSISSDENYTWFVAYEGQVVVGFCCVEVKSDTAYLRHSYVIESKRKQGIYSELFKVRLEYASQNARAAKSTVAPGNLSIYEKYDFTKVKSKGKYSIMEKHFNGSI